MGLLQPPPPSLHKIDTILEIIDLHGIERLRARDDKASTLLFHWVFYEAVDAQLRIIYSKILRMLKRI